MTDEPLTPERAVRLLRAKAGELESAVHAQWSMRSATGINVQAEPGGNVTHMDLLSLAADIALVATLLADHIERGNPDEPQFDDGPAPWRPDPNQPGVG